MIECWEEERDGRPKQGKPASLRLLNNKEQLGSTMEAPIPLQERTEYPCAPDLIYDCTGVEDGRKDSQRALCGGDGSRHRWRRSSIPERPVLDAPDRQYWDRPGVRSFLFEISETVVADCGLSVGVRS